MELTHEIPHAVDNCLAELDRLTPAELRQLLSMLRHRYPEQLGTRIHAATSNSTLSLDKNTPAPI